MIFIKDIPRELKGEFLSPYRKNVIGLDDIVMLRFHIEYLKRYRKSIRCVEIGSFLGSSSLFLSNELGEKSILYCIDPWSTSKDFIKTLPNDPIYQVKQDDFLYKQFLSNIYQLETSSEIAAIRSVSTDVASTWQNGNIDLLWIDGDHSSEAVKNDIESWMPYMAEDAIICGDDYHENDNQKVVDALEELSSRGIIPTVYSYWYHWWCYLSNKRTTKRHVKLNSVGLLPKMIKVKCFKSSYRLFTITLKNKFFQK